MRDETLQDDVAREALQDWLDERPPRDKPDPYEYEDAELLKDLDALSRAALTPWPPEDEKGAPPT